MKKIKVCSSQYSYIFGGDQVHFPYSIATNVAYSIQFPEIKDNFHFEKVFLLRDFLQENIEFAKDADILLCSCYCWNWEITKKLASAVKEINPKCLIVFGGPEVPDADRHSGTFFQNHPYVDIICHGEGELVLHNILKKYIEGGDFRQVNGIEMKDHLSQPQERMSNLDLIPSPWSTDLIWDLVEKDEKLKYVVSWETNRGCPYQCTFAFSGDTLILDQDRAYYPRDEEFKKERMVCEHGDKHTHQQSKKNKNLIYNGVRDCLKFELKNGLSAKMTPEHPVFCVENNEIVTKRADEIKVGDWVPFKTNTNKITEEVKIEGIDIFSRVGDGHPLRGSVPKTLDEDLAWLMGLLIGDGTIKKGEGTVRFVANPDIETKIKTLAKKLFNIDALSVVIPTTSKVKHINLSSVLVCRIFKHLGVDRDDKLRVPKSIFHSPPNVVRAFLRGLYDADGYLPKENLPEYLTTASQRLAEECAGLIYWVGDVAKVNWIDQKKYKPNAKYNIQPAYRVQWFFSKDREKDNQHGACNLVNQIPLSFNLNKNNEIEEPPKCRKKEVYGVSRYKLRKFDSKHPLLEDDLYFTQIKSIGTSVNEKVYDLANQKGQRVTCNGILQHNCDWGSSTKQKIRNFSEEKLAAEIEWFGKNGIVYIDCCDGNFGIFVDRDFRIAEKLSATKMKTGFPEKIGLTWAKNSSEKILPIAKKLKETDLLRAVSLSVQSLDEPTLKVIRRSNIKFDKFEDLIKTFDAEGIQTYTELIYGLPGSTLTSFKQDWEEIAGIYPPPTTMVWPCSVFVNAPMNDAFYRKLHGIEEFISPVFMSHSNINKKDVPEVERMVGNTTSVAGKMKDIYLHNWVMVTFHSFGLLEFIARYFNTKGVSYTKFYETFKDYCETNSAMFGCESGIAAEHAEKGFAGKGWEHFDASLGGIAWPLEEGSFLRLVRNKASLRSEIEMFLTATKHHFPEVPKAELEDLLSFHLFTLCSPQEIEKTSGTFQHDWKKFFITREPLEKREVSYVKSPLVTNDNKIQWGYESIWYGRRSQRYKIKLRDLREE